MPKYVHDEGLVSAKLADGRLLALVPLRPRPLRIKIRLLLYLFLHFVVDF